MRAHFPWLTLFALPRNLNAITTAEKSPSDDVTTPILASTDAVSVTVDLASDVTVISPNKDDSNIHLLQEWLRKNQAQIRSPIFAKGGLVLRGWPIHNVTVAEELVFSHMQFPTMELYPQLFIDFNARAKKLSVSPGLTQTKLSRDVPPATDTSMQPPHTEFGAGPFRPRVAGFYAELVPDAAAPTARVYFPEAIKRLSRELYGLLRTNGWWTPLGQVVQPALLVHPETGLEALQLYSFSKSLSSVALEAYQQIRATERPDLPQVLQIPVLKTDTLDYSISLVAPNGTKFEMPHHLQLEYYKAIFSTVRLLEWHQHDLLLLDNILYGHMRMPGRPRTLHAIFAQEIDSRQLHTANAPDCVVKTSQEPALGAVQGLLNQLGAGGNLWVLWCLSFLPDILFQIFGNLFWTEGGVSGAWHVFSDWFGGADERKEL